MSALVPYVPGAVSAFGAYKRRRVITPIARYATHWAYHNSGTAARAIQRAWRRRKRMRPMKRKMRKPVRKRTQPSVKRTAKQSEQVISNISTDVNLRHLEGAFLPAPQAPQDPSDFNVRDKASIYYSGFKICRWFENRQTTASAIYTVNYAIIQVDPGRISDETVSPTANDVLESCKRNFFVDSQVPTGNTKNFTNANVSGTTLWDIHYDCAPMNPRKGYRILLRKKFTLYPRWANTGAECDGRLNQNFKRIEMYIPIKKRLQFQSRNSPQPNAFFFEIWWTNTRSPDDWPGTNPGANVDVKTLSQHKVYFRD